MSEVSINQASKFVPSDMFRLPAQEVTPITQAVEEAEAPIEASAPIRSIFEHTSALESVATEVMQEPAVGEATKWPRMRKAAHLGKRAVEATVLSLALNPLTNEGARFAFAAAVQATTKNPALTALAWGGSTLAIESGAAVITSDLLESDKAPKTIAWLNKILGKVGVKETTTFNPVVKAGISYLAGSGVAVFVEQREDPNRTRPQNIRYGLKNAAALGVVCGAQGALVANGIANPNPLAIGGAVIGVGSVIGAYKWAKDRVSDATPIEATEQV